MLKIFIMPLNRDQSICDGMRKIFSTITKNFMVSLVCLCENQKHLFIGVYGCCGPQKLSVKYGPHKRILCWGCPDFIIRIVLTPFTLQKVPSFALFHQVSYYSGLYNPETKHGFRIIKSGLYQTHSVGGLHHKENILLWIWPFFYQLNGFSTLPSYKYHPSPPPSPTNLSHPLILFLLQPCVFIIGLS